MSDTAVAEAPEVENELAPAEPSRDVQERSGALFGWCITGHHGDRPGVPIESGLCPGSTSSGLECCCSCHTGVELPRARVFRGTSLGDRLDAILADDDDEPWA